MMIETQSTGSASPTGLAPNHSGEEKIVDIMTQSRTYEISEIIPSATLSEFGEQAMQREFADFVQAKHANATVTGWTVTLTVKHDGSDTEFLRNRMIEQLATLPEKAISAFS